MWLASLDKVLNQRVFRHFLPAAGCARTLFVADCGD
jgi:hypothetical protein